MHIYYLHHSSIAVLLDKSLLIFDYYRHRPDEGMDNGYVSDKEIMDAARVYVFVSHSHNDHYNPYIFEWEKINQNTTFILDSTVPIEQTQDKAIILNPGKSYDDGYLYVREFGSTDIGGSFYIECENLNFFHAGDFNYWHWKDDGNKKYTRAMKKYFDRELEFLSDHIKHIDYAFFPVDSRMGSDYDEGADMFIEMMAPKVFVPIHFADFADTKVYSDKKSATDTEVIAIQRNGQRLV
ncbi:MAG: MBL fold metallo-hydrolase [Christensenellales bacterium]|jgi:L-ascorbate metabolism protein UlaG (beta-lactamase superfamily)